MVIFLNFTSIHRARKELLNKLEQLLQQFFSTTSSVQNAEINNIKSRLFFLNFTCIHRALKKWLNLELL